MALRIKTTIAFFIGLVILLIFSTLVFAFFTIRQLRLNLKMQVESRTTILTLKDNLIYLLDAETGERGFVISGDPNYLEPYRTALNHVSTNTAQLETFVKADSIEKLYMDTLEYYIRLKLDYIKDILALKAKGDEHTVKAMLVTNNGKIFMDAVRRANAAMLQEEEKSFQMHSEATGKTISNAFFMFIVEAIVFLLITVYLGSALYKELFRRLSAERKIMAANADLERKNSEIEQFAYIASHDLQEPLRSITNFSRLLTERVQSGEDGKAKDYVGYISGAAKRMSKLIFDLLEYSRVGKEVEKHAIDCNRLVSEVLEELADSIQKSGAQINVSRLPEVQGYGYLKSVFLNLVGNAIKFRKKDEKPVIKIECEEKPEEYLFSISDNGIGLEKEYFEKIFKIFQRLHGRSEYEGTGIGLSQCKKIIELHGGKIGVHSKTGKGSTFYFTIPKT